MISPASHGYVAQMTTTPWLVKFGMATNVRARILTLSQTMLHPVRLVAIVADGREFEREAALRLKQHRALRREWYAPHPDVIQFVYELAASNRLLEQHTPSVAPGFLFKDEKVQEAEIRALYRPTTQKPRLSVVAA